MHFSIILTLFIFGMGQEVQIKNLKDYPGILPVYQGQAKIQTRRHDFIHSFPLQPIEEKIAYVEHQFENVTNFKKNNLINIDYINIMVNESRNGLGRVQKKFSSIFPFIRTKLYGIKAISKNLDQEDGKYYNQAIKTLTKNDENIISRLNHYMSLNTKIMEKFNEKISLISQYENKIEEEINSLPNGFHDYIQIRNILKQLNFINQIILQLLVDLKEAVNLAKNNILHNSLIEEELHWIIKSMLKHHSKDQLLYAKEEDFYKYYNIIEVDAYYTYNTIVFILHIPIIFPSPFSYYHLFSVPTQNLSTIIPFAPYLLLNPDLFQYNVLPCKKIEREFLCKKKLLQERSGNKDCIIQILQIENEATFCENEATFCENEATFCENVPIALNSTIIENISEVHYIAIFPNPTEVYTSCSSSKILNIQGSYLIELPPGCEFKTNKKSFINSQLNIMEKSLTLPNIKTISVRNVAKVKPLKLDKIHLDELYKLTKEEENLQLEPIKKCDTGNIHYWMIPIYILLTILVLFIGYKKCRRKSKKINKKETTNAAVESEIFFDFLKITSEDG